MLTLSNSRLQVNCYPIKYQKLLHSCLTYFSLSQKFLIAFVNYSIYTKHFKILSILDLCDHSQQLAATESKNSCVLKVK
jgi:hypothetical protein